MSVCVLGGGGGRVVGCVSVRTYNRSGKPNTRGHDACINNIICITNAKVVSTYVSSSSKFANMPF